MLVNAKEFETSVNGVLSERKESWKSLWRAKRVKKCRRECGEHTLLQRKRARARMACCVRAGT